MAAQNVLEKQIDPFGYNYKRQFLILEDTFNYIFLCELIINLYVRSAKSLDIEQFMRNTAGLGGSLLTGSAHSGGPGGMCSISWLSASACSRCAALSRPALTRYCCVLASIQSVAQPRERADAPASPSIS
eukprot:6209630-Pleurochrysis_carterae.AAC.3